MQSNELSKVQSSVWRSKNHPYLEIIDSASAVYMSHVHLHEDLEIAYESRGPWQIMVHGERYTIASKTVVIIAPEQPHKVFSNQMATYLSNRYIGLRIQSDVLSALADGMPLAARWNRSSLPITLISDKQFKEMFCRLHTGLTRNDLLRLEHDVLIQQLLVHLSQHTGQLVETATRSTETYIVQQVKMYLQDHYYAQVSLQELAQLVNMSTFHLNRLFSLNVGVPPHTYQLQIRISRAKRLLAQGCPISAVALHTGFNSQSHFGAYFKRIVGLTPRQFIADVRSP